MNECCKDEKNLEEIGQLVASDGTITTVRQCQVCQRKHYVMELPPIEINAGFEK